MHVRQGGSVAPARPCSWSNRGERKHACPIRMPFLRRHRLEGSDAATASRRWRAAAVCSRLPPKTCCCSRESRRASRTPDSTTSAPAGGRTTRSSTTTSPTPSSRPGDLPPTTCPNSEPGHGGLLLQGPTGVGKTHLAVAVLRELIQRGLQGFFFDYQQWLKQMRGAYDAAAGDEHRVVSRAGPGRRRSAARRPGFGALQRVGGRHDHVADQPSLQRRARRSSRRRTCRFRNSATPGPRKTPSQAATTSKTRWRTASAHAPFRACSACAASSVSPRATTASAA